MFCPLARLHDVLMGLQKKQLQQLSGWLTLTEERIQKMESVPLGDDLPSLQKLLEEHRVNLPLCFLSTKLHVKVALSLPGA